MPLVKGYSLIELTITLSISSLLLLSVSSLLMGLHQQTLSELKRVQLLLQAQQINELIRTEFFRAGFKVSAASSVIPVGIGVSYLGDSGYERLAVHLEDNKLKLCRDSSPSYSSITSVCDEVSNFSMLNDKLISVDAFEVTDVASHAFNLEYELRPKGQSETYRQSLLVVPKGVTRSD
ncbi:hypothetical protein JCM19231_2397 [Vibrio ishigakensis]|uniref:Uncharacterized protein n=1 Tax=Vibrio ishigakensis TaxID=1481914 RepID=A0A0B8NMB7_9VIBR|nr:prepilin-type N-terminal cleavage/methylation domain-containing protein [Vibrio ishigakensis]GAM55795.1 hypothetical protein JCM19231_2397 [Vibrio ishigakensis]